MRPGCLLLLLAVCGASGLDPNGSSSQAPRVEDPQFGCNASGRGGGSVWGLILAVGLRVAASRLARHR
jgi:hypothetical protein